MSGEETPCYEWQQNTEPADAAQAAGNLRRQDAAPEAPSAKGPGKPFFRPHAGLFTQILAKNC